ncbi:hypothetical protein PRECH8_20820 [Insulibacter thermoxylanivorax]|uniref:Uncharacterized protein n=1 Tax=Insulibacter thermoxylanivorax TaxID=2749268 RepID=A0A916QDK7_9BACL|nr:hypothetical protein PRECH8_20820 [Insulibacter thermoxylanivorax]
MFTFQDLLGFGLLILTLISVVAAIMSLMNSNSKRKCRSPDMNIDNIQNSYKIEQNSEGGK